MRIGIDARELCGRATGVGRYLGGLLHEWSTDSAARMHEFVLYAPGPVALALDSRRFPTRTVAGSGGTWWEQAQAPAAAGADHLDVWFAPAYTAPLGLRTPIVLAIHDLSFVAHPEWFRVREGARRRWLTKQSARRATAVVTISEFSKRELMDRLDVPEARIHVIPPGIAAESSKATTRSATHAPGSDVRRACDAPSPRVLFVGSIFNRRHVPDLIRAFAPLARSHPDASLDIVGDNRSYPREDLRRAIAAEGLDGQVRWHEYATDEELADLYRRARAFAFLSEYEGLGLTPLEALAAGVPPVLLDTPVARESCGDAALYVGVHDLRATTRALESVLFDEGIRSRIRVAAERELAKYQWPRAARETLAVIERAGGQADARHDVR
jgi:glycosyltransferase involved in cell wall biosynthesis